jgi:enoyl-CoA hydratase/carnithine racemase
MLSSEWIDSGAAFRLGIAWRVVTDTALLEEAERVAAVLAALDPVAVAATKRLLTEGRAEAVRAALDRESAAMSELLDRQRSSVP